MQIELAGLHLERKDEILQKSGIRLHIFINMNVVMLEFTAAFITMHRKGRYQIEVAGSQFPHAVGHNHLGRSLRDIVHASERAAHVLPVPVGIVGSQSHMNGEQMQMVDRLDVVFHDVSIVLQSNTKGREYPSKYRFYNIQERYNPIKGFHFPENYR